ncbi:hypothetical protein [Streptomyces sp. NPDC093598]|uniref:hypothetical protein n=1 Tax=Streptomyces sp. NPDC093598 TaxID=3366046 RepID=UPI003819FFB2
MFRKKAVSSAATDPDKVVIGLNEPGARICMAEAVRPDTKVAHLESVSLDQSLAARLTEAGRLEAPCPDRTGDKTEKSSRFPDREAGSPPRAPPWPPSSSPTGTPCG